MLNISFRRCDLFTVLSESANPTLRRKHLSTYEHWNWQPALSAQAITGCLLFYSLDATVPYLYVQSPLGNFHTPPSSCYRITVHITRITVFVRFHSEIKGQSPLSSWTRQDVCCCYCFFVAPATLHAEKEYINSVEKRNEGKKHKIMIIIIFVTWVFMWKRWNIIVYGIFRCLVVVVRCFAWRALFLHRQFSVAGRPHRLWLSAGYNALLRLLL